jgi:hypothetical protein
MEPVFRFCASPVREVPTVWANFHATLSVKEPVFASLLAAEFVSPRVRALLQFV